MAKFEKERKLMADTQLKNRDIHDPAVLSAMQKVNRHEFVPQGLGIWAYADQPLPIGYGQTISQPYIVAYMTQELSLTGKEKVLEIGTGSGYQTAILAETAGSVYSVEIIPQLCSYAAENLGRTGYTNVFTRCGNGYAGWKEKAPFDRIILTAAPGEIPGSLLEQLSPNGKLIAPIGIENQELILFTKGKNGELKQRFLLPVRFVPMTGSGR